MWWLQVFLKLTLGAKPLEARGEAASGSIKHMTYYFIDSWLFNLDMCKNWLLFVHTYTSYECYMGVLSM